MSTSFQLVHAKPSRVTTIVLSWMLFAVGLGLYFYTSQKRHQDNPEDRIMPTVTQMFHGMGDASTKPAEDDDSTLPDNASMRQRFFASMLWKDTLATSRRFIYSILLLIPAVLLGLHMGLFPFAGEMIASTDGLAYRIALLRRHMGMDVIIPYVLWVALLLFLVDLVMRVANRKLHPWFQEA